jgi:hypothetical protein
MDKDEWYSRTVADTGNAVTGGAALLVRIKRGGGMSKVTQRIGAIAAQNMLDEINAAVEAKRPKLRLVKNAA